MATRQLTREQCEQTVDALNKCNGNRSDAAALLKLRPNTYFSRLKTAHQLYPGLVIKDPPLRAGVYERPVKAPAKEPPQNTTEDIAQHREARSAREDKQRLKEALEELSTLRDQIKDLQWGIGDIASFKPAEWTFPNKVRHKSEHMPYLLTSDFQVGEVVRKEETEHGYGYDVEIFKRRYKRMIEVTIYLLRQHSGAEWTYPGIIYARGGDPISGGIHQELRETDALTSPEAAKICAEVETEGLLTLASEFGKVFVPCVGHSNHSRITFKPQAKKARANSYDLLIDAMIMSKLSGDKRFEFQITESPDVYFPIYEHNVLLTHGDNIGSRGGQGFIGPVATMIRGWQRVIMEQLAIGRKIDSVHNGHFHTPVDLGWGVGNGSMPGYSEFAKVNRMRPSVPQQLLMCYHPRRGVVDKKPLILTEA